MPELLMHEIILASLGSVGVWVVSLTPLQVEFKKVLQGGLVLATLVIMARVGGLF